ncbi:MAG: SRPBCC family protein [Dehalococcoidia bacterium]
MKPRPNGVILRTTEGLDLVITRQIVAPIEDVWASITEPERSARWFGAWRGTARPGATIELQMAFEEGQPWFEARIDACEPPKHLAITQLSGGQEWSLEVTLTHNQGVTELRFVQHQLPADQAGAVGPGWEYYLDMLVASREGDELPNFDDYYPSHQDYYERQLPRA